MKELRYPIGMQTFSELIEEGYAYVDKTRYIKLLLKQGKFVFLSRPRRFGKSLFISTLKSFFEGKRELFKGLAIDEENGDWTPSPVLHFDFNTGAYLEEDGLSKRINSALEIYEYEYGIANEDNTISGLPLRFETLIRTVHQTTGRKVVILVDEYDKPLLELSEDHPLFLKHQKMLKNFYSNFKSMDEHIRFAFITGVARFGKVSIFSDLNNLDDISMEESYAEICGLTETELNTSFRAGIESLARYRGEEYSDTLKVLRDYYDGYRFTQGGKKLYNPYSVLKTLKAQAVDPFWFETGTPTFLVKLIRSNLIDLQDINGRMCTKRDLMQVRLWAKDPLPLMFQTGYLTIDGFDPDLNAYTLRFPNREVEIGFAEELLPMYINGTGDTGSPFAILSFRRDLFSGNPEAFMKRLATAMKDLPVEDQSESVYRSVTYLICKLCSLQSIAEHHGYKGRSDLEVITRRFIYLFEFKYNRSVSEALSQIHSRDYAGRYALDSRRVVVVGANFENSKDCRELTWEIQFMK